MTEKKIKIKKQLDTYIIIYQRGQQKSSVVHGGRHRCDTVIRD